MKKPLAAKQGKGAGTTPTPTPRRTLKRRKTKNPVPGPKRPVPEGSEPKKTRGVYLRHAGDCRRLLSRTINEVLQETRDDKILRAVAYGVSILLRSLEVGDLESRIIALEKKFEVQQKNGSSQWPETKSQGSEGLSPPIH